MAYLGKTPSQAVRSRYYFTASGGETSLSPSEVTGLSFTDANYVDVSLNGVALVSGTDYTATPSTNTISGLAALTASDVVEIVVYDTFSVFGGNVNGDFNISGGTLSAEAVTVTGLTTTGNINFGDNDKAVFGAGSDLQIYHDGSHSYVSDQGTGNLNIQSNGTAVVIEGTSGANNIIAYADGATNLYYNGGSPKLATTSSGIDVTGTITFDGGTTSADLNFGDNDKAVFGAGNDLQIYHTATSSLIEDSGTGNLLIRANDLRLQDDVGAHFIHGNKGSDVKIYHPADGTVHFATTATGIDVTGAVSATSTVTGSVLRTNNVGTAAAPSILFDQDGGHGATGFIGGSSSEYVAVINNGSETARFTNAGNVGIGTSSPSVALDVQTSASDAFYVTGGRAVFTTATNSNGVVINGIGTPANYYFDIRDDGAAGILRVDSSGNVGIGTDSPSEELTVSKSDDARISITSSGTGKAAMTGLLEFDGSDGRHGYIGPVGGVMRLNTDGGYDILFQPGGTEKVRFTSGGRLGLGNASPASILEVLDATIGGSSGEEGFRINDDAQMQSSTDNSVHFYLNDSSSSAGTHNYIVFRYQGSNIGDIDTTDNTTIRYNTFTGAHWGQFSGHSQPDIKLGTVMSTIDEMCNWTAFEYTDSGGETQKTDIAGTYEIGSTHTIYIDEDGAQATGTAISHDTSKRIAKVKVSDTAGDRAVYGVFAGHYKDGDSSVESLGLGSIRIGSGVTVAIGDLLESAGDGTARPQTGDTSDLIKSSTIAKVTSTTVSHTYDDGSYLVPCVLMAG